MPLAIIRRPARSVTQSAPRPRHWILEFEASSAPEIDPLMGWTTSADPYRTIRLTFPDAASAIRFAEANDWRYIVLEDNSRDARLRGAIGGYRHRLYKGVDVEGALRLPYPTVAPATITAPEGQEGSPLEKSASRMVRRPTVDDPVDPVEEASLESFPASDPPAWTGSMVGPVRTIS